MGQANKRGSFEQRCEQSIIRQKEEAVAFQLKKEERRLEMAAIEAAKTPEQRKSEALKRRKANEFATVLNSFYSF